MKLKIKKISAVMIALLVLAMALSSCSSSQTVEETTAATEAETETEATEAATETEATGDSQSSDSADGGETTITVSVRVECQDAVDYGYEAAINVAPDGLIYDDAVELAEGATVMDALTETGLVIASEDSEYGTYVTYISSLGQGDCGSSSGWMFMLNGEYPSTSAGETPLTDGDEVVWSLYCEAQE